VRLRNRQITAKESTDHKETKMKYSKQISKLQVIFWQSHFDSEAAFESEIRGIRLRCICNVTSGM
jgi:hypothetical protein